VAVIVCGVVAGEASVDSKGKCGEEVLIHVVVAYNVAVGEAVTNDEGKCGEEEEKIQGVLQCERRWEMAISACQVFTFDHAELLFLELVSLVSLFRVLL
jgi:hypothetical protein